MTGSTTRLSNTSPYCLVREATLSCLVAREEVGVDHGHVASVVEGVSEFVEDVLPQDVVIQLPGAPHVEGEAAHLAFHFAVSGLVPVILGVAGGEIHDVVVPFQLVRHFPKVIPRRDLGLTGKVGVDDGVGVEVEDLFLQPVQVLVQFQSGVTGGEGGDEEVDAPVVCLVVAGSEYTTSNVVGWQILTA